MSFFVATGLVTVSRRPWMPSSGMVRNVAGSYASAAHGASATTAATSSLLAMSSATRPPIEWPAMAIGTPG